MDHPKCRFSIAQIDYQGTFEGPAGKPVTHQISGLVKETFFNKGKSYDIQPSQVSDQVGITGVTMHLSR